MQHSPEFSDELVALAKNGDRDAFAELVARRRPLCLTIARSIVGDQAEAEDHVQTAFLKAWRGIGQLGQDAAFSSWLTRIVTNECLMAVRRRVRATDVPFPEDSTAGEAHLAVQDRRAGPEDLVASEEIRRLIDRELQRLPSIFRSVLVLADLRGCSMDELAAQLGISTAAAKSRLTRARRELRNRMMAHTGRMGFATLLC
jgi:RNA polymerase sigma-70 factor (ECF subfamily)